MRRSSTHARSSGSKIGIQPAGRMMKRQDDVFFWYTGANQVFGNSQVGAIVLQPDLALNYVYMKKHVIDAPLPVPADLPDLIVAKDIVGYKFRADFLFGRSHVRNFLQNAPYSGSVGIVSIHLTMVSFSGSKKISFTSNERRISRKIAFFQQKSAHVIGQRKIEQALWIAFLQGNAINTELADCILEIVQFGKTQEALYLHHNTASALFRGNWHFRAKVDVSAPFSNRQAVGIVGNRPSIPD